MRDNTGIEIFMSGSAKLTLEEWLQERYGDCINHASTKIGFDREGLRTRTISSKR